MDILRRIIFYAAKAQIFVLPLLTKNFGCVMFNIKGMILMLHLMSTILNVDSELVN